MLAQIDGSHHDWLGGRGPWLTLLLAVDDATGTVPHALFREQEDTQGYFLLLRGIIQRRGIPVALYSDRHAVFQHSRQASEAVESALAGESGPTQFGRAMQELGASHQYVAIAAHFDGQGLSGLARLFYEQAAEEREHAMKFVHFVIDAGGRLEIPQVAAPRAAFESARDAVALALESEERVTGQIYELVNIAKEEQSYIALRFLDWFVSEQFEEVSKMSALLQVVERAGEAQLLAVEQYLEREGEVAAAPDGG